MNELVVKSHTGEPVTSSLMVAEKFGKQHKHVLEAVRGIISSAENSAQFYQSTSYTDSSGKQNQMYIMNRDGFSLLVMGFTGRRALEFKIAFIEAFNRLEEHSRLLQMNAEVIRSIVREELRRAVPSAGVTDRQPKLKPCEGLTVKDDDAARHFFGSLECNPASKETMYANACVLNAIRERMIADTGKTTRRRGGFMYLAQMGRLLDGVWAAGWRHNLPTNARRLHGRFHAYMYGGYRSLVNGNIGNQNARKY